MSDKEKEPLTAPGDFDYLALDATKAEKKDGNYTRVTRLSLDEAEPS